MLSSIPAYFMQTNLLPGRILDSMDKISRDFIWGSTPEKKKLHMMSWKKITRPKAEGGLGIQASKPKNLALLAKLNWRYHTEEDKDWVKVIKNKYKNLRKAGSST